MNKLPIHRAPPVNMPNKLGIGFNKLPEVELIRAWHGYPIGYVFRPVGVLRQVLMQQKIAVMVGEKQKAEPAAEVEEEKPVPKKRGRPKKVVDE